VRAAAGQRGERRGDRRRGGGQGDAPRARARAGERLLAVVVLGREREVERASLSEGRGGKERGWCCPPPV
jgi:hypothetical protein